MEDWFQICNMRTSLLHLQFIYSSLRQQIQKQHQTLHRANRDRLMQYWALSQQFKNLQQANLKRIIILKLQSCLSCYQKDDQLWQLLDEFTKYVSFMEQQMMENMSKLYIGKNVMFNAEEVQQQMRQIQSKIISFLQKYGPSLDKYDLYVQQLKTAREAFQCYMRQLKAIYKELEDGYPSYLKKKLQARCKEIDSSISSLKASILDAK